jgi:hypothetical protein
MTTAIANLQRTKRIRQISPYNGFQMNENRIMEVKNHHNNKSFSIIPSKYENAQVHNYVTNNRKTEKFLKDQNFFEEDYLTKVKEGRDNQGGFDDIGVMVVSKNFARRRYGDHKREDHEFLRGKRLQRKLDLFERFNSVGKLSKRMHERNRQGDSKIDMSACEPRRSSSVQIRKKRVCFKEKEENGLECKKKEPECSSKLDPQLAESQPILPKIPRKIKLEKVKRPKFSHSVERRIWHKRNTKRKMSFNSFQRKRHKRSETDFIERDLRSKKNKNIRRKSGNLSGLESFVKMPFRSRMNLENIGNLDDENFKKFAEFPDFCKTHVLYNQARFDVDPRDYKNKLK